MDLKEVATHGAVMVHSYNAKLGHIPVRARIILL